MTASVSELPRRHQPRPAKDSARSVRSGQPCSLLDHDAYPVSAACAECGMPITAVSFYMAFYHDDPPAG